MKPLDQITPDDILYYLENTDDRHLGWLERAYGTTQGRIDKDFKQMVSDELTRTRQGLRQYDTPILTLYRGIDNQHDDSRDAIHWTPVRSIALDFGKYVYETTVPNDAVDWIQTIVRRIGFPHEQEISLVRGIQRPMSLREYIDLIELNSK